MTTITTIDNEVLTLGKNWRRVEVGETNPRWINCPTIIDNEERLWVDESVLEDECL